MELTLRTNSIEDRTKLLHWLELAYSTPKVEADLELKEVIDRLKREIVYYQTEQKFKDDDMKDPKVRKELEEEFHMSEEEIDKGVASYLKQIDERWQKALATYHFMMKGKYDDAISYLKEYTIEDEAVAYGKDEKYGGKVCKDHLIAIQDMFIEFIHHKVPRLSTHELYNDYIDEWYFSYGEKEDIIKYGEKSKSKLRQDYFFPCEVFLIKLDNDYYYYSETNGQGTSFVLGIYDEEKLKELANQYGKTLPELKHVYAIDFDKIISEDKNE